MPHGAVPQTARTSSNPPNSVINNQNQYKTARTRELHVPRFPTTLINEVSAIKCVK